MLWHAHKHDGLDVSGFPLEKEGVRVGLALLPEDVIFRGFPPLLEAQKKRSQVNLTRIEQVCTCV